MKHFRVQITTRLILILGVGFLCSFLFLKTSYYITATFLSILILLQFFELINFQERSNQKLIQFLEAIKYSDFTTSFREHGLGKNFDKLNQTFNEVLGSFNKLRQETEEQKNYLQTIVQHVGIGLLVFNEKREVVMVNRFIENTLRLKHVMRLEQLQNVYPKLFNSLITIKPGQQELIKIKVVDEVLSLSLRATQFRIQEQNLMIVSVQNIFQQLEENEQEAWNKLIRVLTHEIMNSVTPIATLAGSSIDLLPQTDNDDLKKSLETIEKRSQGLLHFVEDYRSLTKIPTPNLETFSVRFLFLRICELFRQETTGVKIVQEISSEYQELEADEHLIEQVMVNLVLNALQAVKTVETPSVVLRFYATLNERPILEVIDNGPGVPDEHIDKIFIPFYTSKKEGSGIGLSISKQIMRSHRGTIQYIRLEDKSVFRLTF
ncbi:MAG: ATP-binding protein [Flavobacteriales bacterium]|nr:ATP-binding protein [Flavobacteriales bacterium]